MDKGQAALGRWALIDLETTGIDPSQDEIIDVGYLIFEGIRKVGEFRSLVRPSHPVSEFILKLTGISRSALSKAPHWSEVQTRLVEELEDTVLIAHNANFEKSFLQKIWDTEKVEGLERFQDSLPFLALCSIRRKSLSLESFILEHRLRKKEVHQAYEDALDLGRVLYLELKKLFSNPEKLQFIQKIFEKYQVGESWLERLLYLDHPQLDELGTYLDLHEVKETEVSQEEQPKSSLPVPSFDAQAFKDFFSNTEAIRSNIASYQYRQSQEEMALKIGQCLKNKIHGIIQAPTGTGKTFAYLIPLLAFNRSTGEKVLISTGTKTLQSQAYEKDLPQVKKLLGLESLKTSYLVGSQNHLCEFLFRSDQDDHQLLFQTKSIEEKLAYQLMEILFWENNQESKVDRLLNRLTIPGGLTFINKFFADLCDQYQVDFRACLGKDCDYAKNCSYYQGLSKAREADLIVSNHALTMNWPKSFERPSYIVLDEAHRIEKEATSAFSIMINQRELERFIPSFSQGNALGPLFYLISQIESEPSDATEKINLLREEFHDFGQIMGEHLSALSDLFELTFKKISRYQSLYWNELRKPSAKSSADETLIGLMNRLKSVASILGLSLQKLSLWRDRLEANTNTSDPWAQAKARFEKFHGQLEDYHQGLQTFLADDDGLSYVLRFHEGLGFEIAAYPLDIGLLVKEHLLDTTESVIFTSATLANHDGSRGTDYVEWATGHRLISPEKRFKSPTFLPAVYDYANKAKVFLCDDTLPIYDDQFVPQTLDKVFPIIKALEGRSLFLFSSKVRFAAAQEFLLKEFEGKIPLFIQSMGQNIIEEYKESANGILLGMDSLAEGVDLPGDLLKFIYIDKIPDVRRDLVIEDRRKYFDQHIGNEFEHYFLATRARELSQRLGRLLRTEQDSGWVIVTDRRIKSWKSKTLNTFFDLMKPYQIEPTTLEQAATKIISEFNQ